MEFLKLYCRIINTFFIFINVMFYYGKGKQNERKINFQVFI